MADNLTAEQRKKNIIFLLKKLNLLSMKSIMEIMLKNKTRDI